MNNSIGSFCTSTGIRIKRWTIKTNHFWSLRTPKQTISKIMNSDLCSYPIIPHVLWGVGKIFMKICCFVAEVWQKTNFGHWHICWATLYRVINQLDQPRSKFGVTCPISLCPINYRLVIRFGLGGFSFNIKLSYTAYQYSAG